MASGLVGQSNEFASPPGWLDVPARVPGSFAFGPGTGWRASRTISGRLAPAQRGPVTANWEGVKSSIVARSANRARRAFVQRVSLMNVSNVRISAGVPE